jgi:hypothetical protein
MPGKSRETPRTLRELKNDEVTLFKECPLQRRAQLSNSLGGVRSNPDSHNPTFNNRSDFHQSFALKKLDLLNSELLRR